MLRQLIELKDEVVESRFNSTSKRLFEGAGLVITDEYEAKSTGDYILVKTQFAHELSALVFQLREICRNKIDFLNKYEFFGRLGQVMNRSIGASQDKNSIFLHVVDEAICFVGKAETIAYFAYGSNMDAAQMTDRCSSSKAIGVARLIGYQFALDSNGTATISDNENNSVWGILWEIGGKDVVALDRYEGVKALCYRHSFVQLEFVNQEYDALVYISNRDENRGARKKGYLEKIVNATEHWQFPSKYRKDLTKLL